MADDGKVQNKYNKKPNKRGFTRTRYHELTEVQEAYARVFSGKGSANDAELVLKDFDYILMSMKVTENANVLHPDPVACQWAAGIMWFLNQVHNNISAGNNPTRNTDGNNDEYIRGVD